jgi:two-component system phosphate regulon sensor histidine kinase PhoR
MSVPGPADPEEPAPARPAERIRSARYILAVATAAVLGASLVWNVPFAYSAAVVLLLFLIAGFAPRRRIVFHRPGEAAGRATLWPDTAVKATVEAIPQPTFLLDPGATVRYANAHAGRLFPQTRPADPFTLTFRQPEVGEALSEVQAGRTSSAEFHPPGEATHVYSMTFSPVPRPGGGVDHILVTFDDVSERLAVARMRADFVANASHELRTPLASLTGFIETLLGPARNDPEASEKFLRIMLDQARRMRRLIDDLLSLSRVEMRVHRRPTDMVDLAAVLRHVKDAMTPLAAEHSVALSLDAPAGPVDVIGSRDELVQVFQNLVENAIRYGASGGRVDIGMEVRPGGREAAAVHVRDYGPGIAPDHLPRLTERFYRVDVGASRAMKGTGLGLAIVKHILTRHRSELQVESRPGEGARFTVEFGLPQPMPEAFEEDQ